MKEIIIFGTGKMAEEIAEELIRNKYRVIFYTQRTDIEEINKVLSGKFMKNTSFEVIHYDEISLGEDKYIKNVSIIIEASKAENNRRLQILKLLSKVTTGSQIVITNTQVQSITYLASKYKYKESLLGIQFYSPVISMEVVGIVKSEISSENAVEKAKKLIFSIHKNPVVIDDSPGFVVGKIMVSLIIEAIRMVEEGIQTAECIDKIIVLGMNLKQGPLALADKIGLDIVKNSLDTLYYETKDPRYRPCKLLNDLVISNHLGVKTKRGIYSY